jgi:hypothetical protein
MVVNTSVAALSAGRRACFRVCGEGAIARLIGAGARPAKAVHAQSYRALREMFVLTFVNLDNVLERRDAVCVA